MKRLALILAFTLGLASFDAAAQWYLFPGFSKKAKTDTTAVQPVTGKEEQVSEPVIDAVSPEITEESAVAIETTDTVQYPVFIQDIPETISLSLLLPFESKGKLNSGMMEFYSGALLAARDLGRKGISIDFNVYDCSAGHPGISDWALENTDVLIGPIAYNDILQRVDAIPEGKFAVSPLDAQAVQLVRSFPVIQAAAGSELQMEEMFKWILEDREFQDRIVVVRENGADAGEYENAVIAGLDSLGINYSTITYGILQGLRIGSEFLSKSSHDGTTRFIIASENESFVGDAVRNIGLLQHKGRQVALYGTSKLRSYPSIETDDFHTVGLRLAANYYADYNDPDVKAFVLAYRTLFNAEPGSFAFSGYDITKHFVSLCARYGRNWALRVDEAFSRGLYSDFSFTRPEGAVGAANTAVRRVVYNPDFTISISR